jgi:hypothetical protein
MRKLLVLSALAILTTATSGCNCMRGSSCCWRGHGGGLFGGAPTYAAAPAYGQAAACCCPQVCCDPCAGASATPAVMTGYGSEGCCQ